MHEFHWRYLSLTNLGITVVVALSGFFLGIFAEEKSEKDNAIYVSTIERKAPEWHRERIKRVSSEMKGMSFSGEKGKKASLVLAKLLKGESLENWEEALQIILDNDSSSNLLSTVRILFCKWSEEDFQSALERAGKLGSMASNVKQEMFAQLIRHDPEQALVYFEINRKVLKSIAREVLHGIAYNWAKKDASSAWEWLCTADLTNDEFIVREFIKGSNFDIEYINQLANKEIIMHRDTLSAWVLADSEAALKWAESHTGKLADWCKSIILTEIAKQDLNKAVTLLENAPEKIRPFYIGHMAETIKEKDEALKWVIKMSPSGKVGESELNFVWKWAREDPLQAIPWIKKLEPSDIKDMSITLFAKTVYTPLLYDETLSLIENISNTETRNSVFENCIKSWQYSNKQEFNTWVHKHANSPLILQAKEKGHINQNEN